MHLLVLRITQSRNNTKKVFSTFSSRTFRHC